MILTRVLEGGIDDHGTIVVSILLGSRPWRVAGGWWLVVFSRTMIGLEVVVCVG